MKFASLEPRRTRLGLLITAMTVSVGASHAQTPRLWIGGGENFSTATNWDPAGEPVAADPLTIDTGIATLAGANLSRGAATNIGTGGTLAVSNGRFLNANGAEAGIALDGGSLQHSGQFFIVALNNTGELVQSAGQVSSAVTEAFYLSDGGGARGTYRLEGGTLEVILSGTSGLDRQVHLGKQNNGDLLLVGGGDATVTAASNDRRFYLSRNSTLRIDSGSVTADGFQYFVVGRETAGGAVSTVHVTGGSLDVTNLQSPSGNFAFVVANNGVVRQDGGAIGVTSGPVWIGDGGAAATIVQSGGDFAAGGEVVLSRAAATSGQYVMKGGTLRAADLVTGPGPSPRFYFQGGSVILPGDRSTLVEEPWIIALGEVSASYDVVGDETTLSVVHPEGTEATRRYYRFAATQLRTGVDTGAIQLSEFSFFRDGQPLDLSGVTVTNPNGDSPPGEIPAMVVDGDLATKWLDAANQPLVFDFGTATAIDAYSFTTGNDAPERDPVRWVLEGSDDGATWEPLHVVNNTNLAPGGRLVETFMLPLPEDPAPAVAELVWSGSQNADWDRVSANWQESGPQVWSSDPPADAIFRESGPKAISIIEPVVAESLSFEAAGYEIGGTETLTLAGIGGVVVVEDAAISASLAGNAGLNLTGGGTLTLDGENVYNGLTMVNDAALRYAGAGSSAGAGPLTLAAADSSRALLTMDSAGTLEYSGSVRVGAGNNAAAAIMQTDGFVSTGGPGVEYLEIGGGLGATTGSWGGYHLAGGLLDSGRGGSESGIRVGNHGIGTFVQTGGVLDVNRWFAVGGLGGEGGEGVASFLGGEASVAPGFRFLVGDQSGSYGTINLGTLAGGDAVVTSLNATGFAVGTNGSAVSATLNLNSGTLVLGGPLFKNSGAVTATVNFNGGTMAAGADGIELASDTLSVTNVYNGGLTLDTGANTATVTAHLLQPFGNGIYPSGGAYDISSGGSGYLGAPLVKVTTNGFGFEASAIAEVEDGEVIRVLITCPGQDYQIGDEITFTFIGGGATAPAPPMTRVLGPFEMAPNEGGDVIKTGSGRLVMFGNLSHAGDTLVQQGVLESNGFVDDTAILVSAGATLTGNLDTFGPVEVSGTLAPGSGTGEMTGDSLLLAAGSTLEIDIDDWDGSAGSGYDSASFNSLAITATAGSKLTVRVADASPANFAESARDFTLIRSGSAISGLTAANWQVDASGFIGSGSWDLGVSGGDLVLSYLPGTPGYGSWIGGFAGLSDTGRDADPDDDGLNNLLEYILNGDPGSGSTDGILPSATAPDGDLVFTFVRRAESKNDSVQVFQYGSDFSGWTDLAIPAASAGNVSIAAGSPATGLETVTVTVPADEATDGRLFGRLSATAN